MKCKRHPKYQGIRAPTKTNKHLYGCGRCWEIYLANLTEANMLTVGLSDYIQKIMITAKEWDKKNAGNS